MKVYLDKQTKLGPWGGGSKTVNCLIEILRQTSAEVTHVLEPNIDIIFFFDPRLSKSGYTIYDYIKYRNKYPRTKLIQRIGDVGTHNKPELTKLLNDTIRHSDVAIFPSVWAKEYLNPSRLPKDIRVVPNGALKVFFENRRKQQDPQPNLNSLQICKVITHHWSDNLLKGFETYKIFDDYLDNNNNFSFTYIGRWNKTISYPSHSIVLAPMDVSKLKRILPKQDIYLTASRFEAGANHVLEAMAAGLPVVYHCDGGSIAEYCKEYGGLEYSDRTSLIRAINEIRNNYSVYSSAVMRYTRKCEYVTEIYFKVIKTTYERI